MHAVRIRDLRLPIAVATLVAMAGLSIGTTTSILLKAERGGSAAGSVPDAGEKPARPKRAPKPAQEFKGKGKTGGLVAVGDGAKPAKPKRPPKPAQEFKGKTKNGG